MVCVTKNGVWKLPSVATAHPLHDWMCVVGIDHCCVCGSESLAVQVGRGSVLAAEEEAAEEETHGSGPGVWVK